MYNNKVIVHFNKNKLQIDNFIEITFCFILLLKKNNKQ